MQYPALIGARLELKMLRPQRGASLAQQRSGPVDGAARHMTGGPTAPLPAAAVCVRAERGAWAQGFFFGSGLAPLNACVGTVCGGNAPQSSVESRGDCCCACCCPR